MKVTYFVVLPFVRTPDDDLIAEEPIEARSAEDATRKARQLAPSRAGVLAFRRSGDPDLGEFDPAEVLIRLGETPAELD